MGFEAFDSPAEPQQQRSRFRWRSSERLGQAMNQPRLVTQPPRSAPPVPLAAAPANTPTTSATTSATTKELAEAGWRANLLQRIGSAALLIALVISIVFCGGWIAFVGALGFLCLGTWELSQMFEHKGWRPQMAISILLGADFLFAAMFPAQRLLIIAGGISATVIVSFGLFLLVFDTYESALRDWALTLASPFYLGWPLALFVALRGPDFGLGSTGFWWVVATFGMVWANDTAAYVTGHFFGKTKLAPRISPAKTWEGLAGGVVFSIVAAFVLTIPLHLPWYAPLIMGVAVAAAATAGDLAESLLKRGSGVKDSGTLIPGHGGLLDRMDSLLFAVMIVIVFAAIYDPLLIH